MYRFLVPGWSAKPLVSAYDRIMGTHRPVGPPISGSFGDLRPEQRYPEHAKRCGSSWSMSVYDSFENHDAAVCDAALTAAIAEVEAYPSAETAAFDALNSTSDAIDDGFEMASTLPRAQWPADEMARYSQTGWEAVDVIRSSVDVVLDAAAALAVISALADNETYEERGILVPAERARVEVLRRWLESQAPKRPANDGPASLSFWDADTDPLGFWAAALVAARMQVGRAHVNGEASGAADSLLNR